MKTIKREGKRRRGIPPRFTYGAALLILIGFFLGGCATLAPEKPSALVSTDRGTVAFMGKYEFARPPAGWRLIRVLEAGDFELGFMRIEKGGFPSQTTFIYDDEPFGSSRKLDRRSEQYCTRFLFNSGMFPQIQKKEKVQVMGQPALALYLEGENPNRSEKAKSKIYLIKKGERIISFVCTQWRPLQESFNPEPFEHFETFVRSFKFLKPSFYDELHEKIKKLKG
jgi:hypothetical protein